MKCPHCNKNVIIYQMAIRNCESYGSNSYNLLCNKCKNPITVYLKRVVKCGEIVKGKHDKNSCDWPQ